MASVDEMARKIAEANRAIIRDEIARALRAPTGVIPGTYGRVSVDARGRVMSGVGVGSLIASANRTTPQTISNATTTVIDFDSVAFDPNGYISGSGSGWVFTAPQDGFYQILHGNLLESTTWAIAGRYVLASALVNGSGSTAIDRQYPPISVVSEPYINGVVGLELNQGDTVAITEYQNSGGAIDTGGSLDCYVQVYIVGG